MTALRIFSCQLNPQIWKASIATRLGAVARPYGEIR